MKFLKASVTLLVILATKLAVASPVLKCVDVIGDEMAVLAKTAVVEGQAVVEFQDRIAFSEDLEAIFGNYIVAVKEQRDGNYLMSYSLKFSGGLVLLVDEQTVTLDEPMMIPDFVDALEGVGDEQAADCWITTADL